jgi:hypothetical protein
MNRRKKRLLLEQADRKLEAFRSLAAVQLSPEGWISTIRIPLGMILQAVARTPAINMKQH